MNPYVSSHLKDMNRKTVFRMLCKLEETSKSELSHLTGISAPTVMKIVQYLVERDLVLELGDGQSALGRKPQMIKLNKNRYLSLGAVYEGSYLQVGAVNLKNEIVGLKKYRTGGDLEEVLDHLLFQAVNELLVESDLRLSDVLALGLGIPGTYDVEKERLLLAPLAGLSQQTKLSKALRKLESYYGKPVVVDNDLNMEVQGEFLALDLEEQEDLLYFSFGTGVGSGVILDGKLRRGAHYLCGEIGYLNFSGEMPEPEKGGWLESRMNLRALQQRYGVGLDGKILPENRKAAQEEAAHWAALCIHNVVVCYDCGNVSLGGEVFDLLGEGFFEEIGRRLQTISLDNNITLHRCCCPAPGVLGAAVAARGKALPYLLEELE